MAATSLQDAPQVLAPWRQKLTSLGLAATDQDLIVSILEKHALESNRLTAVYRLDADQLDQLMPLDVVPTPRKVVRVGLVIVRNIDPAIATEIDTLVAQLGDPKWDTREAAYKRLIELGLLLKTDVWRKAPLSPTGLTRVNQYVVQSPFARTAVTTLMAEQQNVFRV